MLQLPWLRSFALGPKLGLEPGCLQAQLPSHHWARSGKFRSFALCNQCSSPRPYTGLLTHEWPWAVGARTHFNEGPALSFRCLKDLMICVCYNPQLKRDSRIPRARSLSPRVPWGKRRRQRQLACGLPGTPLLTVPSTALSLLRVSHPLSRESGKNQGA